MSLGGPSRKRGLAKSVFGWPASDPLATAIGGTHSPLASAGEYEADPLVWNDGGNYETASGAIRVLIVKADANCHL